MRLECRIPISPRPAWLNRVRLIAKSLRQWFPDALMTISCYPVINEALLPNSVWRFPSPDDFNAWKDTRSPYLPTMMNRYVGPFWGDFVLMLDADVLPVAPFPEWLDENVLCGVQAHVPPCSIQDWCQLFQRFGLAAPDCRHLYSGVGVMCGHQLGPLYFNSGVVFGRRELFERLSDEYLDSIDFLKRNVPDTYWFDQQGLALAIAAANVRGKAFGLRYNFPNRPNFDRAFPDELSDVRFLHAMQTDIVDRDADFESAEALQRLCARTDLDGSNEVLRSRVASLLPIS